MTYKETLNKARKNKIETWKLLVADEVEARFQNELDDESFEIICEYVYDWTMKTSEEQPYLIVHGIITGFKNKEFTIRDIKLNKPFVKTKINKIIGA